jgi:amino acid transporter
MALNHVAPTAKWASAIVAFGSVIAHTAVLLVFQLGQPRIFFSMARDGLLPPVFAKVHPRFKTPHITTIFTGVIVGGFAAVMSIDEMVDLTNIGTLFAFVLVCVGIIILRYKDPDRKRPFKVPSSLWWYGVLALVVLLGFYYLPRLLGPVFVLFGHSFALPTFMMSDTWRYIEPPVFIVGALAVFFLYQRSSLRERLPLGAWALPLLGAGSCIFLMIYLPPTSWWRFIAWLLLGLAVYLSYSYSKSEIGKKIGRAPITAPWLMLMALGSFLLAIGLLTIPHEATLSQMIAQLGGSFGEAKQTFIGTILIVLGIIAAGVGAIIGAMQKK